jgi:hypothetical protein
MRIRILRTPPFPEIDGVVLEGFEVGREYELGPVLGAVFLAEGWAEPVADDAPRPPELFGSEDPFAVPTLDRATPPNLIREHAPPYIERDVAADFRWRRRKR